MDFGDQMDTQLRDPLLAGINNQQLLQKLLLLLDPSVQHVLGVFEQ